jgi:hypothetical protein
MLGCSSAALGFIRGITSLPVFVVPSYLNLFTTPISPQPAMPQRLTAKSTDLFTAPPDIGPIW